MPAKVIFRKKKESPRHEYFSKFGGMNGSRTCAPSAQKWNLRGMSSSGKTCIAQPTVWKIGRRSKGLGQDAV